MLNYEQLFRLEGRIAVVIGAGSGIGQAAAKGLAAHGAFVVCADVNLKAAQLTADQLGAERARASSVDITNTQNVAELLQGVVGEDGRIDVVVTTPATNVRKPINNYRDEEFDRVVELNLKGTFRVLRHAGRIMTEQRRGSIIAFSSIRSQVVEPGQGVYAATKAGIVQLVRTLATELGPSCVRVNAIAPGVVDTPLTSQIKDQPDWYAAYAAKSVFNRWASVDEMVGSVIYLASDASSYVTGSVLVVDGGWTAADGRFTPPV